MLYLFVGMLGVSVVGMGTVLALKRYELASGAVFFSAIRPRASDFFARLSAWLTKHLPAAAQHAARRGLERAQASVHRNIAKAIIATEFGLEKALRTVKDKTAAGRIPGEASPFLREVAEHKKKLLRRPRTRAIRAIIEE